MPAKDPVAANLKSRLKQREERVKLKETVDAVQVLAAESSKCNATILAAGTELKEVYSGYVSFLKEILGEQKNE